MSSFAWLRILVGLEWAAIVAAILVDFVLADSLPDPLRSYAPDLGSLSNEIAVGFGALLALLLHVAGSIAIVAGWSRARALYTAGTAGFLDTCLEHARKTDAFCHDVPAIEPEADWPETAWAKERCQNDPRYDSCVSLQYAVQAHCAERR